MDGGLEQESATVVKDEYKHGSGAQGEILGTNSGPGNGLEQESATGS